MKTVCVVGGGPAGMMAAITASRAGAKVVLLEKNEKVGKKLYITGKGRCNVTNNCSARDFFQNVITNPKFLFGALNKFAPSDTIDLLENAGLKLKTERGNRVFPFSDKSSDVIKALNKLMLDCDVDVRLGANVISVTKVDSMFDIITNCDTFKADYVIIATGGISYSATGSTGDGYKFARSMGHNVTKLYPALCRILCKGTKYLEGLSLKNVNVSLVDANDNSVACEFGEMLFTDDGVSGPAVLSLSSQINKKHGSTIQIDLKPALDSGTLDARLLRDFSERMNKEFRNSLDALVPERLANVVVSQSGIDPFKRVNVITAKERAKLVYTLKHLTFPYVGLADIDSGIVTCGGVDVSQITPSTMESKLVPGLYFAGEVMDVDAYTGGFNVQIAFSTGYVAGLSSATKE